MIMLQGQGDENVRILSENVSDLCGFFRYSLFSLILKFAKGFFQLILNILVYFV